MSGNSNGNKNNTNGPKPPFYKNKFYWAAGGIAAFMLINAMSDDGRPDYNTDSPNSTTSYTDSYNGTSSYPGPGGQYVQNQPQSNKPVRLDSVFWDLLDRRQLENLIVQEAGSGFVVRGNFRRKQEERFYFTTRDKKRLYDALDGKKIPYYDDISAKTTPQAASNQNGSGGFPLLSLIGLGLMGFMVWHMLQQRKNGGIGTMGGGKAGFGKNKAKLLKRGDANVTFDDVAGVDEAKEELGEVVDFLRTPQKYTRLGGKMPTGALLVGPPGTGKTLMARAVAGEANVPFFSISGSDFVEMFVGVGASRVRDMFAEAKKNSPCIIFIDEIDAIGKKRGAGPAAGGNDEREQTLNQLLVEMDGFESDTGIVIIAATNRVDTLDDALLRPGRFDRQVQVPKPVLDGREKILDVHMRKIEALGVLGSNVDRRKLAIGTPGFSGADLANLVNEAALLAARRDADFVEEQDFEEAKDKIMMGYKRKTQIMSPEEKTKTARHEVGHALVGLYTDPPCDPLYKITAIPRGGSLGVTINIPEKDAVSISEAQLHSKLAMAFGGRKAEELIYGKGNITTGAANDIQQATKIARAMVLEWGFSDKIGRIRHVSEQNNPFGAAGGMANANYSEATQQIIDAEIKEIIDKAEATAERILTEHKKDFDLLTEFLDEHEELSGEQVRHIIEHGDLPKPPAPLVDAEPELEQEPAEPEESQDEEGITLAKPANDDNESPGSCIPSVPRKRSGGWKPK